MKTADPCGARVGVRQSSNPSRFPRRGAGCAQGTQTLSRDTCESARAVWFMVRMGGMKSLLSVVVPCFNEAEVLWETHGRLVHTLTQLTDLDFEIIYVDDGSRDATPDVMGEIQALDPRVRTLRF